MKRLIAIALTLVLVLSAVGCRPTLGWVDAPLQPGKISEWKAVIGPTYGSSNLDVSAEEIRSNPAAYGYTVETGQKTLASGARYNHVWLTGCIDIPSGATDVAIYDVLLDATCLNVGSAIDTTGATSRVTIYDVEVTIHAPQGVVTGEATGIGDGNFDCYRCDVHGWRKAFFGGHDTYIQDSLAYDMDGDSGGGHLATTFFKWASNVTVVHSYFVANLKDPGDCCVTGAVSATNNPGENDHKTHLTITDSYLDPGEWTSIDFGPGSNGSDGGTPDDHLVITNNVFRNIGNTWWYNRPEIGGDCGPLGTSNLSHCYVTSWPGSTPENGNIWSNNHNEYGVLINEG